MTTQTQIRASFWEAHPDLDAQARARRTRSKGQNAQNATTRTAFVDYVDSLARDGTITEKLAHNVTL
jgi:hypothetical protein